MLAALPPPAAGLLALLALVLLPGLLFVRAPWAVTPALSLAFWALSAWWPPLAGLSRARFLAGALVAFGLLASLRLLPKHEVDPPPGWPQPRRPPPPPRPGLAPPRPAEPSSWLIVATALALLVPLPLWHHAPGPRMAFQTTTARLLLWRDGVPLSAEPLLPLAPVGAHAPAIATLGADLAHVAGLDAAPSVLVLTTAAASLVLIGLFALYGTWCRPRPAAWGALLGLAAAPWPAFVSPWGDGEALLGLAFLLPASALLLGHASRSSALAAGVLLGAGALAQPLLAAAAALWSVGVVALRTRRAESRAAIRRRLALALAAALVLAGPGLLPLVRALSPREAAAIALPRAEEALAFGAGMALLALAPLAAARLEALRGRRGRLAMTALAVVGAAVLCGRVQGWLAAGQLPGSTLQALARSGAAFVLEPLCAPDGARDWVPALAGRPAGEPGPWIPPVYRDEWASRPRRPCGARLEAFFEGR